MPTQKKYALCLSDGSLFLNMYESVTPTGYKIDIQPKFYLENAKLYSSPSIPNKKARDYLLAQYPTAKFVPVEETIERSIKLLGYGIEDEKI